MGKKFKSKVAEYTVKTLGAIVFLGIALTFIPLCFDFGGNIAAYAAESSKDTLEKNKSKALKNLEKVYKYYSKSYYTAKEYDKLTEYYNNGVTAIKACKDKASINETYNEYKELLDSAKPSKFVKYQKKMEKSLLKSYKSLVSKNEYSDYSLSKLENFKDEGVEKIYATKTKAKAKKAKNSYVKKMKGVTTLLSQTRTNIIDYINGNSDLGDNEKATIIEQINELQNPEEILAIGEKFGYEEVVDETITAEQIEARIKELCKKYPKYSEEEIRVLVATANMDFVDEEDWLTIFKVSSKKEISKKTDMLDDLIGERIEGYNYEHYENFGFDEYIYDDTGRTQKEMIQFTDLCLNPKVQKNIEFLYELSQPMLFRDVTRQDQESFTNGNLAVAELIVYMLDLYEEVPYFKRPTDIYAFNDKIFDETGIGYIYKQYAIGLESCFLNNYIYNSMPSNHNLDEEIEAACSCENPILKLKQKIKK
jgi:hypothetical protein